MMNFSDDFSDHPECECGFKSNCNCSVLLLEVPLLLHPPSPSCLLQPLPHLLLPVDRPSHHFVNLASTDWVTDASARQKVSKLIDKASPHLLNEPVGTLFDGGVPHPAGFDGGTVVKDVVVELALGDFHIFSGSQDHSMAVL